MSSNYTETFDEMDTRIAREMREAHEDEMAPIYTSTNLRSKLTRVSSTRATMTSHATLVVPAGFDLDTLPTFMVGRNGLKFHHVTTAGDKDGHVVVVYRVLRVVDARQPQFIINVVTK